jgi:uncharacterized membrane protein
VLWLRVGAALCIGATVITTLTVKVPINTQTAAWQLTNDAAEWHRMRERWHAFQGIRGGLFAVAFVVLAISLVVARRSGAPSA